MGIPVEMVNGRRVTNDQTLDIITMVYAGAINKNIVAKLQARNCMALGLCGADGNLIQAHKRPAAEIDFGWVGDIDVVHSENLIRLLNADFIPVLAPLSHDNSG